MEKKLDLSALGQKVKQYRKEIRGYITMRFPGGVDFSAGPRERIRQIAGRMHRYRNKNYRRHSKGIKRKLERSGALEMGKISFFDKIRRFSSCADIKVVSLALILDMI